jgi:hypothetical protein
MPRVHHVVACDMCCLWLQRMSHGATSTDMSTTIENENSIRVVKGLAKQLLADRDSWRDKCRVAERELLLQQEQAALARTPCRCKAHHPARPAVATLLRWLYAGVFVQQHVWATTYPQMCCRDQHDHLLHVPCMAAGAAPGVFTCQVLIMSREHQALVRAASVQHRSHEDTCIVHCGCPNQRPAIVITHTQTPELPYSTQADACQAATTGAVITCPAISTSR